MLTIDFWNGNKSTARQAYETELLEACLDVSANDYDNARLKVDNTDYASAQDEGNIFDNGADILVTVAGNLKFEQKPKIMIPQPLTKGLLGYRLILVRSDSTAMFSDLKSAAELQSLTIGIPQTWADAEMFRQNNYTVEEKGAFSDLFELLRTKSFDYTALGANEIEGIFKQQSNALGEIIIEPSIMIYYPYPLVFYVNPLNPLLAERVSEGLNTIKLNGQHEQIFLKHHGDVVQRLNLKNRRIFTLDNPILPVEMKTFQSTLLD
jgi:ABC-type amino acid transport substrate-binding protein